MKKFEIVTVVVVAFLFTGLMTKAKAGELSREFNQTILSTYDNSMNSIDVWSEVNNVISPINTNSTVNVKNSLSVTTPNKSAAVYLRTNNNGPVVNFQNGSDLTNWTFHALPLSDGFKGSKFRITNQEYTYALNQPVMTMHVDTTNYAELKVGFGTSAPRGNLSLVNLQKDASLTFDVDNTNYSTPNPISIFSRWSIIARKGNVADGNGKLGYLDFAFGDNNNVGLSLRPTEAGKIIANVEGLMRLAPLTATHRGQCKTIVGSDNKPLDPNPYEGKVYYDNEINKPVYCGGPKEAVCWRTLDGQALPGQSLACTGPIPPVSK